MEVEVKVKLEQDDMSTLRDKANKETIEEIVRILKDKTLDECTQIDKIADVICINLGIETQSR